MAPPFKKFTPDEDAAPRVGGYVTYRKTGQGTKRGLIQWINEDGSMRVQPALGRRTTIDHTDVNRANKGAST